MNTTSASLLARVRQPGEQEAWARFVELYTPLIYYWARRAGLQEHDAADLVQDVFALLVRKLPEFVYDGRKSFRSWLRTVTLNKWRDRQRQRTAGLNPAQLSDGALADLPGKEPVEEFWDAEYRQHVVGRALDLMRREFHATTWMACWETVVVGRPAAEVAAKLGISVASVYAAKSRVLRRLRQELNGLLD